MCAVQCFCFVKIPKLVVLMFFQMYQLHVYSIFKDLQKQNIMSKDLRVLKHQKLLKIYCFFCVYYSE